MIGRQDCWSQRTRKKKGAMKGCKRRGREEEGREREGKGRERGRAAH